MMISKFLRLFFHWLARISSIISIGIILLFFIGEGFNPVKLVLREWVGFLFFPLGIAVGMIVAWRREKLGGIITISSLLLFYGVHFLFSGELPRGWAWFIFSSPGILFLMSEWWAKHGLEKGK